MASNTRTKKADPAFDLGAARAARSEASREAKILEIDGESFELMPSVPLQAVELFAQGHLGDGMRMLFVDQEMGARFVATFKPDIEDFTEIMKGVYGVDPGEPGASIS